MTESRYRVLHVCTHPVQYAAPVFRMMAKHPALDSTVAYCSLQGAVPTLDHGFSVEVGWDVPLLDGYTWLHIPNRSPRPGLERFFGLLNPGLWSLIRDGGFDAVVTYTGYRYASFWIAAAASKIYGKALLFGTDAHGAQSQDGRAWKSAAKRLIWPRLFKLADVVIVPSSRSVALMRSLGIPADRVVMTPYVVDNEWWLTQSAHASRPAVRKAWGIPDDAPVVIFCGKLQRWKRPADVLQAFSGAEVSNAYLVYAGDGRLRVELEAMANDLGVGERVRFLGFTNQSQLPQVYRAADLLVLPSGYEPFGVVVNEAMLCGCAVAVSDQVGASHDLVGSGHNGFVFPCGDVDALAKILRESLSNPRRLRQMGEVARERMATWSPRENIERLVEAVGRAVSRHRNCAFPFVETGKRY